MLYGVQTAERADATAAFENKTDAELFITAVRKEYAEDYGAEYFALVWRESVDAEWEPIENER